MPKPLRVRATAKRELAEAAAWYAERSATAAADCAAAIVGALERVQQAPHTFTSDTWDSRAKRLVLPGFPYAVIFVDKPNAVHIVAIAHAKRRPGYWQGRV